MMESTVRAAATPWTTATVTQEGASIGGPWSFRCVFGSLQQFNICGNRQTTTPNQTNLVMVASLDHFPHALLLLGLIVTLGTNEKHNSHKQ